MRIQNRYNREYNPRCMCNIATEAIVAGIGAVGAIGSAGASGVAQSKLNKKTREFNREEAEKQRQWSEGMVAQQNAWNMELWNKENAYNSPAAQVERLREAGLNPLFYGLDGTGNASQLQSAQPLAYQRAEVGSQVNPISTGISAIGQLAQSKLAIASAGKAEKEGDLAVEKSITESLMRDKQYEFLGVQIDLGKSEEKVNEEQARKYASEINSIEKSVEKMDAEIIESYSRIDVAQRSQKLAEDSFEYTKALNDAKLSLQEKEIAVQWYNANTQRLVGEADIALKEDQRVYLGLEGDHVKAITATENALREGKVERQGIENKTATREYKWMPVEKTIKAVGTAAGIAGGIMLGTSKVKGAAKAVKGAADFVSENEVIPLGGY